ncbi:hypothetical protein BDN71DRAFT_1514591 [Pleurotus eryngii]|uniref:Uncharacterized protein n=1 Tax=Pleurotus eryngii TaxID=5323 RepID=A0A9P5ZG55_PLEER|nr:hypothetical protein BDN71DRAFT_1514591 [Pleurotus eryngii]
MKRKDDPDSPGRSKKARRNKKETSPPPPPLDLSSILNWFNDPRRDRIISVQDLDADSKWPGTHERTGLSSQGLSSKKDSEEESQSEEEKDEQEEIPQDKEETDGDEDMEEPEGGSEDQEEDQDGGENGMMADDDGEAGDELYLSKDEVNATGMGGALEGCGDTGGDGPLVSFSQEEEFLEENETAQRAVLSEDEAAGGDLRGKVSKGDFSEGGGEGDSSTEEDMLPRNHHTDSLPVASSSQIVGITPWLQTQVVRDRRDVTFGTEDAVAAMRSKRKALLNSPKKPRINERKEKNKDKGKKRDREPPGDFTLQSRGRIASLATSSTMTSRSSSQSITEEVGKETKLGFGEWWVEVKKRISNEGETPIAKWLENNCLPPIYAKEPPPPSLSMKEGRALRKILSKSFQQDSHTKFNKFITRLLLQLQAKFGWIE